MLKSIIGVLGTIVYGISQWLFIYVLGLFGAIEDIGNFTFVLSLVSPIAIFFFLSLRPIYLADVNYEINETAFIRIRGICSLTLFIIIISLMIVHQNLLLFLVGFVKVIELISDLIYGFHQKKGDSYFVGISLVIKGLSGISLFYVVYTLSKNLDLAYSMVALSNVIILFVYDLKNFKFPKNVCNNQVKISDFLYLGRAVLPITIAATIHSLLINYPRLAIVEFLGLKDLGIFGSIIFLYTAILTVFNSLIDNSIGFFLKQTTRKRYQILSGLMGLLIIAFIFLVLYVNPILNFLISKLFSSDFFKYLNLFKLGLIIIFVDVLNKLLSYKILIDKKLYTQLLIFILCIPVMYFSINSLIEKYKMEGVFYTLILVSLFQLFSYLIIYSRSFFLYGRKI